jgi:hypothetical protein
MTPLRRRRQQPPPPPPPPDPAVAELTARRERLIERFALMQAELGGMAYEMAIREHVRVELIMRKAAALQRVDVELAQVERLLRGEDVGGGVECPQCGTLAGRADQFCSQCATPLHAHRNGSGPVDAVTLPPPPGGASR